ncbi:NEDD4-binding protein 1 [Diretmus argenteus]
MEGERCDGGGEQEVQDQFACAGMLRGSLSTLHSSVERIFKVSFGIGSNWDIELPPGNDGQIWLKLRGSSASVTAAKLFVKGVVNQEQQQEVTYPPVIHCVFCGARGLFMDCLIRNTSAHIVVGSPGFLLVSGLMEPVVRAYSIITDLVERYEGTQSRHADAADSVSGEHLDSRRAFKSLVEKWEDKHILDLLVLPGSVKEILLDLVRESGLGLSPGDSTAEGASHSQRAHRALIQPSNNTEQWGDGATAGLGADKDSFLHPPFTSVSTRRRDESAEERRVHSPLEVGEMGQPEEVEMLEIKDEEEEEEGEGELLLSVGSKKEFGLLLKFFTAMGYTENVVRRVLSRTGPKEASQILDLVQQEQDRNDQKSNRPCETEHREGKGMAGAGGGANVVSSTGGTSEEAGNTMEGIQGGEWDEEAGGEERGSKRGQGARETGGGGANEENFVLGVLKRAAASCGYTEKKVSEVYSMLPDVTTHQLLLELQRESETHRDGPREVDDVVQERNGGEAAAGEQEIRRGNEENRAERKSLKEKRETDDTGKVGVPKLTVPAAEREFFLWDMKSTNQFTGSNQHQLSESQVRGPPLPTYPPTLDPLFTHLQSPKQSHASNRSPQFAHAPKQNLPPHGYDPNPKPQSAQSHGGLLPATFSPRPARPPIFTSTASGVVVTGEQRFLEGLQTPFHLQLIDKPGDPNLRAIIIDGSNVAMSHGLGQFFSCRGIALAVEHFWNRGHRHICTFLPQWRQKRDPMIKEQHYLAELEKLGLLSYTPSREVLGKRINSYDDRFMLQHAQKTGGVIITKDNLRDLLDESPVWRDIIKKRLLQYTFVGDHFMVPDDPLGRGGPHLDDFLRSSHRSPDPGNHSFAGVASPVTSNKPPRSQTEVLHYRDITPGGALGPPEAGGSRGNGRGQGRAGHVKTSHHQQRSPEETAMLRGHLCQVFPGQDSMVTLVLQSNPTETDINSLSHLILELQTD